MDNESKFLIDICSAYLNAAPVYVPENIDYKKLYNIIKNHNLIGICHCALNHAENKDIYISASSLKMK